MDDENEFAIFIQEALSTMDIKVIARKCEAAVSTVRRWERGSSVPGEHTQAWVRDQLR